jgi:hypothetical protein
MSYSRRKAKSKVVLRVEELERRDAPAVVSSFAAAGVEFNDATRRLDGGLWQLAAPATTVIPESNQPTGFVVRYVSDLTNVRDTINMEKAPGGDLHQFFPIGSTTVTGQHINTILADLTTCINLAPNTVPGSVNARANETSIRTHHLQIANIVHNDDFLADKAVTHNDTIAASGTNPPTAVVLADGIQGFQKVPPLLGEDLAETPHATFNDIGRIFNDAANRIMGGLGSTANEAAIRADITVMKSSLTELAQDMQANPGVDAQLARIHVLVIRDQLPLWVRFLNQQRATTDSNDRQVAPKGSNDITLDLIDIAQNDPVLAATLSEDNPGWAMYPVFSVTQPTPYQDSDAQKANFATMDAGAVNLGNEGVSDVMNGASDAAKANLINRLNAFGTFVGNFVNAGGGIFKARFNNELVAVNSTNGAAIVAMIDALNTNNLDEANAAALQMRMNTADVSGNNRWVSFDGPGGTIMWHKYNADGTTPDNNPVTGVLNQPGTPTLVL